NRLLRLSKVGGQPLEIPLFPGSERMVMALRAIDPHAEERARGPCGQANRIRAVLRSRGGNEVGRRMVRPKALGRNDLAYQLVIRLVLRQLVAQPVHESATAVNEERAVFRAQECSRQTFGEVVRKAPVR